MQQSLNTAALHLRLWIVTVLLATLGFAMVAEFQSSISDDSARGRMAEVSEYAGDSESPVSHAHVLDALPTTTWLVGCALAFALLAAPRQHLPASPLIAYHHRSRAPPAIALV